MQTKMPPRKKTLESFMQRPHEEAQAYLLFWDVNEMDSVPWSSERQMIIQAFKANWYSSLSLDRLCKYCAFIGVAWDDDEAFKNRLRKVLSLFVRAKVLRSWVDRGTRLWEVNY